VSVRDFHAPLRQNVNYLQQAAYFVQLVEQGTEKETALPGILELMTAALTAIAQGPACPVTVFTFEMKLLNELGLKPDSRESRLTPGASRIVNALSTGDWAAVSRLQLSQAQVMELGRFLHGFLVFQLGRIPRDRNAALGLAV